MAIPLNLTDGSGTAAFSATGNGTAFSPSEASPAGMSHHGLLNNFTVTTELTGSPTGVNAKLQGSLDNSVWFELGNTTSTSSDMFHVVDKPVIFIRANVTTLDGGSSPTVTFTCVAGV